MSTLFTSDSSDYEFCTVPTIMESHDDVRRFAVIQDEICVYSVVEFVVKKILKTQ